MEVSLLSKLGEHDNVIQMYGAVLDEQESDFQPPRVYKMMMELAEHESRREEDLERLSEWRGLIGRAKRAPHWGVQSRFRVIYSYMYVCMSSIVYGKTIQKNRMLNAWAELHSPNMCMLKIRFGSLKGSSDYNFRLEFLILPSSGRFKPTCDILIIHFYYTLEQFYHGRSY